MAPSPGTPLGGERPRRRAVSPPAPDGDVEMAGDPPGDGASGGRLVCPVPTCPCSDAARHPGWSTAATLRAHIDAHLAGVLAGDVPAEWLAAQRRQRCLVCGLSVATRFGTHPTCRPLARAAAPDPAPAGPLPGAVGAGHELPSLAAVQAAATPTLRHVPSAARYLWGQALTRALAKAVHHNDERSWVELFMLPKSVLCAPGRGGRKHQRAAAAFTMDRLQRWHEGERGSLWQSRPVATSKRRSPTHSDRQELATGLAREGFDGKACAALLSEGLCPATAETRDALQALHPPSAPPPTPAIHDLPVAPAVEASVVATALRSFPSATAPGCSGLRVQHIREAMPAGVGNGLLDQLVAVVNLLVQGRACPAVAPFLAGANLVALPKPSGGVRPIAIGEVLRRLTGKCVMQLVHDDARAHFWPAQAGVAVKAGVESAVHTLRAWMGRHATAVDRVVVKLDFSNAFNTVSREVVLKQARDHFPALARWATWCYSSESRLQFGDFVLGSSTGVQQGDPLGPLLFAAALQPLAEQLRSSPLDLSLFYLDDGALAGSIASVSAALTQVQGASADLGLALNLRKSEVMLVGRTPPSALQGHLSQALLTSSDGSCRLLHDFDFLGAAIGSAPYMERHAAQRVSSAALLLEAIGALPDAQVALRLLRACGGHARLLHTMRCCPPAAQPAALAKFDQLVQQCFSSFTGIHCSAAQWAQAARGLPLAGLGLRSTADHSPAAYLASVGACHQQCCELDPAYPADLTSHPDVLSAVQLLNAHLETATTSLLPLAWPSGSKTSAASWTRLVGLRS